MHPRDQASGFAKARRQQAEDETVHEMNVFARARNRHAEMRRHRFFLVLDHARAQQRVEHHSDRIGKPGRRIGHLGKQVPQPAVPCA